MGILATGTLLALNDAVTADSLDNIGSIGIITTGTWVGTLSFEGSLDGTIYVPISVLASNGALVLSTTTNDSFIINPAGLRSVRIKATAYTSGTVTATIQLGGAVAALINTLTHIIGNTDGTKIGNSGDRLKSESTQSGTWTVQPGNTANTTAWLVKDNSLGTVAAGTAGTQSSLGGGVFNTSLPTLTNGQQAALQLDSSGKLLVSASIVLSNDTNYGTVGANTLRTASQIGNATGSALFGAGTTTAQVLRVVLPTDQTAIPATQSGTWTVQPGNTANTTPWLTAFTDTNVTGTLTAAAQTVSIATKGCSTVSIDLAGTWVGTVVFDLSNDNGSTWHSAIAYDLQGSTFAAITITDTLTIQVGGFTNFRCRCSAYTSGTVNITLNAGYGNLSQQVYSNIVSAFKATVNLRDGSSNNLTSQANGAQRALDVGINVAGVQVDPRAIRALTSSDVVSAAQSGTWTVQQGTPPWSIGLADKTAFTYGTTLQQVTGGVYQDTSPTLTAGQQGALRLTQYRALHTNLRDASGTAITSTTDGSLLKLNVNTPDSTSSSSISSVGGASSFICSGLSTVTINIGGAWSNGTLEFEASQDGSQFWSVYTYETASTFVTAPSVVGAINTNHSGVYVIPCAGFNQVRVRASALASGTATIAFTGSIGNLYVPVVNTTAANLASLSHGKVQSASPGPFANGTINALSLDSNGYLRVTAFQGTNPWLSKAQLQDNSGTGITSSAVSGTGSSEQALDVTNIPLATSRYSTPINIRQTATTAANGTVFSMRNASGSTRTVYIERIMLNMDFDVATPLTRSLQRYSLCRFSAATPTAGTAQTAIKMDNADAASQATDIRILDTGLTTTSVTFENAFAIIGCPCSDGAVAQYIREGISIKLAPGEGLCIRLTVIAVVGQGLTGEIVWSER